MHKTVGRMEFFSQCPCRPMRLTAIAKTCGTVVTGARVDFAKSVSHWLILTPAVLEFDKATALLHSIGQGSLVFLVEHVFDSRIELPVVANANLTR